MICGKGAGRAGGWEYRYGITQEAPQHGAAEMGSWLLSFLSRKQWW